MGLTIALAALALGGRRDLLRANFDKPWFFINMRRGRVSRFYFDLKFVD